MEKIFLVCNPDNKTEDVEVVAAFSDRETAEGFTTRHPRFHGCYRVAEIPFNPVFQITDLYTYMVILDFDDDKSGKVFLTNAFDEELAIEIKPVVKVNGAFLMYLFAIDKKEALALAKKKFADMLASGEWAAMEDEEGSDE